MLKKISILAILLSLVACNFFEEMADKTTDDARLFQAREYLNKQEYANALAEFEAMSSGFRERRDVAVLYASAHAGLCGLDFLNLLTSLSAISSQKLFNVFRIFFTGATATSIDHCISAEGIMMAITQNATDRTDDENLFFTFISFAKMGSIFAANADKDGDGVLDASFDACSATDISDAYVREVGASMVHVFSSLKALTDVSDIGDGQLTSVTGVLDTIEGTADFCDDTPNGSGNCKNTDPAAFSAVEVKLFRSLINESSAIGLGSCTGSITTCACL